MLWLLSCTLLSCQDDEVQTPEDICPTVSDSISSMIVSDQSGDTLASISYYVRQDRIPGGQLIHRIFPDSSSSKANFIRAMTMDSIGDGSIEKYPFPYKVWPTVYFKYFTLEEINDSPNPFDISMNKYFQLLKNEIDSLNRDPHRFDLEIGLVDDDGNHYTNLPFEGNYRSLGRFSNAQEVLDITVHYLDTLTIQGLIYDELSMRFINMKCSVEGHLLNEDDWTDSLYIEGAFDIYFTPNQEKFECDL